MATGPQFSFASVEAALIACYRVAPADRGRFNARLGHAQKAGLFDVRPGKGTRLTYGRDELHKLVLLCEMSELGIAPAVQLGLIAALWEQRLREIFKRAEAAAMHPPGGHDIIVILVGASMMIEGWAGAAAERQSLPPRSAPHSPGTGVCAATIMLCCRARLMTNLSSRLRVFHNALADVHFKFEQPPIETDCGAKAASCAKSSAPSATCGPPDRREAMRFEDEA